MPSPSAEDSAATAGGAGPAGGGGGPFVLAADIGGTFTDVVLAGPDGALSIAKLLTTTHDPTEALIAGTVDLLERSGVAPAAVGRFVHGTTLATNVILERRGVDVAFVTTAGFGSLLALGREARVENERFDLFFDAAEAPVPRSHTFEVTERLGPDGAVLVALDEDGVRAGAAQIAALGVQAIAICLLHSYANPAHEQRVAALCREAVGDGVVIVTSSEILPEIREYERATTTLMSAYVGPVMSSYLDELGRRLRALGITVPVHIMECSGGVMTAGQAARRAVCTIESGPAAGVIAAQRVGSEHGMGDIISFDMGGTTAKAGVIRDGAPDVTYQFHVGGRGSFGGRRSGTGVPIKVPAIDLAEVGAGGGSIAWVDPAGALHVGPHSAGAAPGPACYGRGGRQPTVTDADLVLGYLGADSFAGGSMKLDAAAAEEAIHQQVAAPLGVDVVAAAHAIHEIANANMATAVHVVTVQRGVLPSDFVLVPLGGAAPMHVARIAERFAIDTVLVPPHAGVGSAVGLIATDLRTDRAVTRVVRATEADLEVLGPVVRGLETEAAAELGDGAVTIERSVDIRFVGQGHELTVALPGTTLTAASLTGAADEFRRRYREDYGIDLRDPVELVTFRVRAIRASAPAPAPAPVGGPGAMVEAAAVAVAPAVATSPVASPPTTTRPVFFPDLGGFVATPVLDRRTCVAGQTIEGPAIVEEAESTLVVPPGWAATVDGTGTIRLLRDGGR